MDEFYWAPGEPNDRSNTENRIMMMMKLDYNWNDNNGDSTWEDKDRGGSVNKFICECKFITLITPVIELTNDPLFYLVVYRF